MSVYSLSFPGKYDLVCLRDSLSQTPAYEYKDGKRTDEQKTDANGCPLYRVVGAFPIIANQVFEGCVVHTTSTFKDQDVQIGQRLSAPWNTNGSFERLRSRWHIRVRLGYLERG